MPNRSDGNQLCRMNIAMETKTTHLMDEFLSTRTQVYHRPASDSLARLIVWFNGLDFSATSSCRSSLDRQLRPNLALQLLQHNPRRQLQRNPRLRLRLPQRRSQCRKKYSIKRRKIRPNILFHECHKCIATNNASLTRVKPRMDR